MSVEGDTDILIYFEAWYYVPGGYCFDICGENIDLCAIECFFLGGACCGGDHIAA